MTKNLTVEEARRRMLLGVAPGPAETVALDHLAVGRVLAEPILAVRDQPPFDASAMDGWAIRLGDPGTDGAYRRVGESAAGRAFNGAIGLGEAIRIFTGAATPQGCTVIIQENATVEGELVRFSIALPDRPTNVRPRGGDFRAGAPLLAAGTRLDAWRLSLAASAGRAQALVAPLPRVAILSTGEEIVRPGTIEPTEAQIFESNSPALAGLIALWGGDPVLMAPERDDEAAIAAAVAGVAADLIVTVGGASVGDYDLVKPALTRLGLTLAVETIALRPGKPTWFGRLADGRAVLGLPGNPASGLVAAELFLRPLLAAWQGADPTLKLEPARLASPLGVTGPREHWMRATLKVSDDATLWAAPFPDQDSSLVSVFAEADALLRRPAGGGPLGVGDLIQTLRLERR